MSVDILIALDGGFKQVTCMLCESYLNKADPCYLHALHALTLENCFDMHFLTFPIVLWACDSRERSTAAADSPRASSALHVVAFSLPLRFTCVVIHHRPVASLATDTLL